MLLVAVVAGVVIVDMAGIRLGGRGDTVGVMVGGVCKGNQHRSPKSDRPS